jgi:hypothetical protein
VSPYVMVRSEEFWISGGDLRFSRAREIVRKAVEDYAWNGILVSL